MDLRELIKKYLPQQHMMQVATSIDNKPYVCTVYYVHDDEFNLYWFSIPTRRHSQEIAQNNKISAAIPIKFVKGEKVVGMSFEGTAEMVKDSHGHEEIVNQYAKKFRRKDEWVQDYLESRTDHKLYKLSPYSIFLFDETNFPKDPKKEYKL